MTKDDMMNRYMALYNDMAGSGDPRKMHIFGDAEKWAFRQMIDKDLTIAAQWVEKLEAIKWNNYLTAVEAKTICGKLVNQDGTTGGRWAMDVAVQKIERLGGKPCLPPYYNTPALVTVMNMLYSDHAQSVAEDMGYKFPSEAPDDKMVLSFYRKAVEKLCDVDREKFVREYFRDLI